MKGITEEELYNLPTAEYVHRRAGFIARQLTVYHVAFLACADLKDVQVMSEWYNVSVDIYSRLGRVLFVYLYSQDIANWSMVV